MLINPILAPAFSQVMNMPQIKQITVFGGTGFIGRHLVRRLAKTGATLCIPTRDLEKALILKPMGNIGQIVPFFCSTRSDASIVQAVRHSDAVINLIGILYEKGQNSFQSVHVETAARLARLAKEAGAKHFVHMSALGASDTSLSSYARSKAAGEQAVRMFFPEAMIARPSVVFGPEDNFFNLFAMLTRFLPILPLIGGGMTKFQPVYAGDIAEALTQGLYTSETRGKSYEFGGPQIYSFREILELILRVTDRRRFLFNLPWSLATLQAMFMELLPHPLLTRDQLKLLKTDNVLGNPNANGLIELGLAPTAVEVILPTYLGWLRKNPQGRYI